MQLTKDTARTQVQMQLHSAFDKQLQYLLQGSADSNLYLLWFNMTEHGNLFFY